jgi:hypothetical protein
VLPVRLRQPDHGEVGQAVRPDDVEAGLAAVGEGGAATVPLATTWALVRTKPSPVKTTPLPAPTGAGPRGPGRSTVSAATLGVRWAATVVTIWE